MRDQPPETDVVVGQLRQVVAVSVCIPGKQFLQVGKTGIHRVAQQADDLRLRQRLGDKTCVEDVGRILVDQVGLAGIASSRTAQVQQSDLCEIHVLDCLDRPLSRRNVIEVIRYPAQRPGEDIQFSCACNAAVIAEDPFKNGGAATGHAHDENGTLVVASTNDASVRSINADKPRSSRPGS